MGREAPLSTHRIPVDSILTPDELSTLGEVAVGIPAESASEALQRRFSLGLSVDPDVVEGFAADSSNLPGEARGLFRPTDTRECALALRFCHLAGIPITLSAGRSNLTGSATPEGGFVLSTENLKNPEIEISPDSMSVRSPMGIILEDLREAVLERTGGRMFFPVDPTSREDAAVGGAVSCNASGFQPGIHGAMRPWVEAVEFLLPDGFRICARRGEFLSKEGAFVLVHPEGERFWPVPRYPRPAIKNAAGPYSSPDGVLDFVDLVVGSEGLFGMVTAVTLGLKPNPADHLELFFSLDGERDAVVFCRYLQKRIEGGVESLAASEYFGANCRTYMDHEDRLFRGVDPVGLYIKAPLNERVSDADCERWLGILREAPCRIDEDAVLVLRTRRERELFFEARHSLPANAFEAIQRKGTVNISTDAVVPPESLEEFLRYTHEVIRSRGLDYLSFGHLADSHLHFTILPKRDQVQDGLEAYDRIIARSSELGGVYSGEHGTGKRKRKDFLLCYGPGAVEDVRRCKAAVDPGFLLNRGNVVKSPAIPGSL